MVDILETVATSPTPQQGQHTWGTLSGQQNNSRYAPAGQQVPFPNTYILKHWGKKRRKPCSLTLSAQKPHWQEWAQELQSH